MAGVQEGSNSQDAPLGAGTSGIRRFLQEVFHPFRQRDITKQRVAHAISRTIEIDGEIAPLNLAEVLKDVTRTYPATPTEHDSLISILDGFVKDGILTRPNKIDPRTEKEVEGDAYFLIPDPEDLATYEKSKALLEDIQKNKPNQMPGRRNSSNSL